MDCFFRLFFLLLCSFAALPLQAKWNIPEGIQQIRNRGEKAFDLELGPKKWQQFGRVKELEHDYVVLKDGSVMKGEMGDFPSLKTNLGNFDFGLEEVAVVEFSGEQSPLARVVTRVGEIYSGEALDAWKYERLMKVSLMDEGRESKKEELIPLHLDPRTVDFVILKSRKRIQRFKREDFFTLVLSNGDRVAFLQDSRIINLMTDKRHFAIRTDEIAKVSRIDDYLEGFLKGDSLNRKMETALVLDQTFRIRLARNDEKVTLPWKLIRSIYQDEGKALAELPYFYSPETPSLVDTVYVPAGRFFLGRSFQLNKLEDLPKLKGRKLLTKETIAQVANQMSAKTQAIPTVDSPAYMVDIPAFVIDKYEVTNAEYEVFVRETGHRKPVHWVGGVIPRGKEGHPVVNVSYLDALSYAEWAGKRLPTEVEWERAAKGSTSYPYPYGAHYDPMLANTDSAATVPVGSYEDFKPMQRNVAEQWMPKAQDLSGNVREWTRSSFDPLWYREIMEKQQAWSMNKRSRTPFKVVRGGSFKSSSVTATTTYRASMHEEDFNDYTGFRCVSDLPAYGQ